MPRSHHAIAFSRLGLTCALAATSALSACDLGDAPDIEIEGEPIDSLQASITLDNAECTMAKCGGNSPDFFGQPFGSLPTDGSFNARGWKVLKFEDVDGADFKIKIENGSLVAFRELTTWRYYRGRNQMVKTVVERRGRQLEGGMLVLRHRWNEVFGVADAFIHFEDTAAVFHYWIPPKRRAWTWELTVSRSSTGLKTDLCPADNPPKDSPLATYANHAVVFGGDEYDSQTIEVRDGNSTLNISCLGSLGAKLFAFRHTNASMSDDSGRPNWQKRQAMAKALGGDFCAEAAALTRSGTPLYVRVPNLGWSFGCYIKGYEAIWNHEGAKCVNTYRLEHDSDFLEELKNTCGLPACSMEELLHPNDNDAYLSTAVPNSWAPDGCYMFEPPDDGPDLPLGTINLP